VYGRTAFEQGEVLSREATEFGEGLVEVVGDALAEQPPGRFVPCGGEIADPVGMGLDVQPPGVVTVIVSRRTGA
jgi:hypothetical protein